MYSIYINSNITHSCTLQSPVFHISILLEENTLVLQGESMLGKSQGALHVNSMPEICQYLLYFYCDLLTPCQRSGKFSNMENKKL